MILNNLLLSAIKSRYKSVISSILLIEVISNLYRRNELVNRVIYVCLIMADAFL
jgi:hypothetical protein